MKLEVINHGYKTLPTRSHMHDAGLDLYSPKDIVIKPNETVKLNLNIGFKIPAGHMGVLHNRSGHSSKGLRVSNSPIDTGYTGPIHAILTNTSNEDFVIEENMKVCQLVVVPIVICDLVTEEEVANEVPRGDKGFSSTGL